MSSNELIAALEIQIKNTNQVSAAHLLLFDSSHASLDSQQSRILFSKDTHQSDCYYEKMSSLAGLFHQAREVEAPDTIQKLYSNLEHICGKTIGEVAAELGIDVIKDLTSNTGWIGNLIESALGAQAGTKPVQDFTTLGIELKTIAINSAGKVANNVFITTVPQETFMMQSWETSHLLYKLQHILFIPIENNSEKAIAQRRIGRPLFWKPSVDELNVIANDWHNVMMLLAEDKMLKLPSGLGQALTVQVKALSSLQTRTIEDSDGFKHKVLPLSFYLKRSFVQQIIQRLI